MKNKRTIKITLISILSLVAVKVFAVFLEVVLALTVLTVGTIITVKLTTTCTTVLPMPTQPTAPPPLPPPNYPIIFVPPVWPHIVHHHLVLVKPALINAEIKLIRYDISTNYPPYQWYSSTNLPYQASTNLIDWQTPHVWQWGFSNVIVTLIDDGNGKLTTNYWNPKNGITNSVPLDLPTLERGFFRPAQ
jgi:hypothetical protein